MGLAIFVPGADQRSNGSMLQQFSEVVAHSYHTRTFVSDVRRQHGDSETGARGSGGNGGVHTYRHNSHRYGLLAGRGP